MHAPRDDITQTNNRQGPPMLHRLLILLLVCDHTTLR
jgi:hypothetical protein